MVLCLARWRGRQKIVNELETEQRRRRGRNGGGRDDREENNWRE